MLALIQFDSASSPLVDELVEAGRLPAIAELRRVGTWQRLESPDAALSAAVYHTLHTGLELGDHGLYHTFQWRAEEQRIRFINALPKPETVWERLSRAGRRSLVVDPFVSWAPRTMNGIFLSGWQYRNRMILQEHAEPGDAAKELRRRFGRPPLLEETLGRPSVAHVLALADRLAAAPQRAADAVVDLLGRSVYDFLLVNLTPAHFAGHWLWDPAQLFDGTVDGEQRRRLDTLLPAVYEAVDAAIARILDALPDDTDVIVFSPVGIGPNTSRSDLLGGMLDAVLRGAPAASPANARGGAIWRLRGAVPIGWRDAFSRTVPAYINRELVSRMYVSGLDWSRTRAFALPGESSGLVRLNLRGRERLGIVDPADADALMDEIADGLATFSDPDGTPAVATVERVASTIGHGVRAGDLPDLIVHWSDHPTVALAGVGSSRFGDVARGGVGTGWPGNHCDDAWALHVPHRATLRTPERPPRVVDLPATVCHLVGVDTAGLAGQPLLEPFA
ncbi:MAG TPA: hypothetical protein DCP25_02570 [Chloroflexi bacterium]|nr:hypothetical protein [Chloroflexota bacterium]